MNASRPSVHPIEAPPPQTNGAAEHPMPQGRMEDIPGMAETRGGLTLRLYQFAFAVISLCVMTTTSYFSVVSAFRIRYLLCQLPCCCCQFAKLWSLSLAMIDFHAILVKRSLRNAKVVSLFAIGDAITSTLTFSAACASAGITILLSNDISNCTENKCTRFESGIAMAFMAWFAVSPSFLLNFWTLASK